MKDLMQKIEFETYRELDEHLVNTIKREQPYVVNDSVGIKRYKVTIEEIEEPVEVIAARIKKMRSETNNMHVWDALRKYAKENNIPY